jgi:hypothetical protein
LFVGVDCGHGDLSAGVDADVSEVVSDGWPDYFPEVALIAVVFVVFKF